MIRPYLPTMTNSEIMAVMVGGFATVAGGVMAAYVRFGIDAGHLLAASVMSARCGGGRGGGAGVVGVAAVGRCAVDGGGGCAWGSGDRTE